ncbi:hypothetical protein [Sphingomonas sp.]|uniref:hypothetical protein n=1 Tax=Sphingomonas sp. TaxID=28214 RepID=UPI001DDE5BBF|nr:hypothetical protein [Sphingomonas sp.]MBX9796057.1 hypothetical protein [Sphingomonas sp.]
MTDINRTIRAFLLAPLPLFLLAGFLALRPSFGANNIVVGLTTALAGSYGLMALVGLPAHFLLRRMGMTGIATYQFVAVFLVWAVLLASVLLEPEPAPPDVTDNGPFAGISSLELIFSAYGLAFAVASGAIAAVTAGLFWMLAVGPRRSTDQGN